MKINPLNYMKAGPSTSIPLLAICALLTVSANQSLQARESYTPSRHRAASALDEGRIFITRTPVLGENVSVTVRIDGQSDPLMKGHTYDKAIAPGRYTMVASVNGGGSGESRTVLDVRPGQTYSYIARYTVNKIELIPLSSSR